MNAAVDKIARAVLYEGYLLYPYRHSALKNQQRWNFGVLYPPAWTTQENGSDRAWLRMEFLAACGENCQIAVLLRFLQMVAVETEGRAWQEAEERELNIGEIPVAKLEAGTHVRDFSFEAAEQVTDLVKRRRMRIEGRVEISASHVVDSVFRLSIRVTNTTQGAIGSRDDALMLSLASAHVVVSITNGQLLSQTDPPEHLCDESAACQNTGLWPVLVGQPGTSDLMLGSPIILYDYPQIAPESQGDLFDGTEIDEILTLRILTLTNEEKEEARRSDERARRILERLETAPQEHLLELHGVMRQIGHASGTALKKGDRVRLRPKKRADVFDALLEGKVAIVEAIEEDFEQQIHVAVVMEDDPGRDLGELRQAGHRFFYGLDEIELIRNQV